MGQAWRVGQAGRVGQALMLTYTLTFNVYRFIVTEMSGESIRCFTLAPMIRCINLCSKVIYLIFPLGLVVLNIIFSLKKVKE